MADTKISALPELTGANTASVDMIPIVDQSAVQTKKITLGELQAAPVSAGTANGILYLNGSKVASSGSALTFDGTTLGVGDITSAKFGFYSEGAGSVQTTTGYWRLANGDGEQRTDGTQDNRCSHEPEPAWNSVDDPHREPDRLTRFL